MRRDDCRTALTIGLAALAAFSCVTAHISASDERDLANWSAVEYSVAGGIAFNLHRVSVARSGDVTAADRRLGMDAAGRAPADLVARLTAFLKTARDARKTLPMPDAIGTSLTVTAAGRTYDIEPSPEITGALESAWNDVIARAAVGKWTQSGWKPCRPAAQMTSTDLDVPIDDLTLGADGTFAITWLGGGARTTGIPHVSLPDYGGTYAIDAARGAMHLRLPSGVAPPRDFAGDGSFQIAQGKLTLKNIWPGTRTAPRRPDICELTFDRK
jgi:hypothetical protein